ncbi:hypothetical protein ADEAN_000098800 [Angomonas deanei]|uniref:Glutathione S-transferase, C-terminal domain containing protein n=1 Tax=Angomonas deanei TaxID=59799 RepID=A0A7G2C1X5_9TRYP|nr:hypothetical protein ADEAN_000098800 [Angomonas deanei]
MGVETLDPEKVRRMAEDRNLEILKRLQEESQSAVMDGSAAVGSTVDQTVSATPSAGAPKTTVNPKQVSPSTTSGVVASGAPSNHSSGTATALSPSPHVAAKQTTTPQSGPTEGAPAAAVPKAVSAAKAGGSGTSTANSTPNSAVSTQKPTAGGSDRAASSGTKAQVPSPQAKSVANAPKTKPTSQQSTNTKGDGSMAVALPSMKTVLMGAAVIGATLLAGYGVYTLYRRRQQRAIAKQLQEAFKDNTRCHLFASPRCGISPSVNVSCTEAETFLRVANVSYVVHFIQHGADLTVALQSIPLSERPSRIMRAHGSVANKSGAALQSRAESPRRSLPSTRRRSSDELSGLPEKMAACAKTVEGYDRDLPMLVHGPSGVYIGCQAIFDFARDTLGVRLDLNLTKEEAVLGLRSREHARFNLSQYVARTLWDHPRIAALAIGVKRGLPLPQLLGYMFLLSDSIVQYNKGGAIGSLSRQAYQKSFLEEVRLLEETLGNKGFLVGFKPSSYDCALYATLLPLFQLDQQGVPLPGEAFQRLRKSPSIREYMRRITAAAFPDLGELLACAGSESPQTFDYKLIGN